jgi:hypothetical protein
MKSRWKTVWEPVLIVVIPILLMCACEQQSSAKVQPQVQVARYELRQDQGGPFA